MLEFRKGGQRTDYWIHQRVLPATNFNFYFFLIHSFIHSFTHLTNTSFTVTLPLSGQRNDFGSNSRNLWSLHIPECGDSSLDLRLSLPGSLMLERPSSLISQSLEGGQGSALLGMEHFSVRLVMLRHLLVAMLNVRILH